MANLVKRRVPLRVAGPIQSQPAPIIACIPKIRTILRASVITAGVVISVRNPHAIVAATSVKVPKPNVVTTPARPRYNGFIDVIAPPRTFLPRATRGKVNFIGNTYRRNGSVLDIVPPKTNLPRVKPFNSRVIQSTFRRDGLVVRGRVPKLVSTPTKRLASTFIGSSYRYNGSIVRVTSPKFNLPKVKPFAPKVIGAIYRRDGKVYVSRHSNTVVIPVTSVRPKIVKVIPDIRDKYRRVSLPGRSLYIGPKDHPVISQSYVAILASLDLSETWQSHFTSRGWASIQDQINAGYALYCEPTVINGSYEQVVDYGVVINNTIATVRFSQNDISGSVATIVKIATSLDGVTYSAFTTASSLFSSSLRFVKYRLEFTAASDKSVTEITNLEFIIDTKTELDSGNIVANAGDVGGTQVFFNKVFKSIDSITLTVNSQEPVTAIYQFTSVPNPTSFFVFALDSSGNRTTYTVSWKARGVV